MRVLASLIIVLLLGACGDASQDTPEQAAPDVDPVEWQAWLDDPVGHRYFAEFDDARIQVNAVIFSGEYRPEDMCTLVVDEIQPTEPIYTMALLNIPDGEVGRLWRAMWDTQMEFLTDCSEGDFSEPHLERLNEIKTELANRYRVNSSVALEPA